MIVQNYQFKMNCQASCIAEMPVVAWMQFYLYITRKIHIHKNECCLHLTGVAHKYKKDIARSHLEPRSRTQKRNQKPFFQQEKHDASEAASKSHLVIKTVVSKRYFHETEWVKYLNAGKTRDNSVIS